MTSVTANIAIISITKYISLFFLFCSRYQGFAAGSMGVPTAAHLMARFAQGLFEL